MAQVIPIHKLQNTGEISKMCHESAEPIYITEDGRGDMVLMSMETYENQVFFADVYRKLAEAEDQIANGEVIDAEKALDRIRAKYSV
jgi:PHD/YefM family antitoxin component YafN of YafNO toxin-antitoxin module